MPKFIVLVLATLFAVSAAGAQTPPTAQDYLKSSFTHYQGGAVDAALADVNKAIELDANFVDALFLRAAIRSKKGDTAGVLADYSKIIEIAPSVSGVEVVYNNRSVIRLQNLDVNGALDDLNKAIAINPKAATLYNGRAVARLQKGDLDGSLADYEKAIELSPTLPSAFLGRGSFRYQKGDFDSALADFGKAIELAPNYGAAYVVRGIVRGLKGEIDAALADIKTGATLMPHSVSDRPVGNFSSPFMELNQYVLKNPANARAYQVRGIFKFLQGHETEAAADFAKAMELEPKLKADIDKVVEDLRKNKKAK